MSRAARGLTQLLQPCCMSIFPIWEHRSKPICCRPPRTRHQLPHHEWRRQQPVQLLRQPPTVECPATCQSRHKWGAPALRPGTRVRRKLAQSRSSPIGCLNAAARYHGPNETVVDGRSWASSPYRGHDRWSRPSRCLKSATRGQSR